jgi:16S rRNA (cytidine1402-2'-O)-methyltransferase
MKSIVYLIPSLLDEEAVETIPSYIIDAVKNCQVFFVENERTARRYLKKIWREMAIDNYEWFVIEKADHEIQSEFKQRIKEGKSIGIISEAGCPGVADPGQELVSVAQKMNVEVKPLVGPNSVLLALMASGMNGQQFQFAGYLPINEHERIKAIKELEAESQKKNCTQIFIETPYRNRQLIESILKTCKSATKFCIAVDLTGKNESIKTKTIAEWKKEKIDLHKRPAIFLLLAE